jgi:CRISPR-associated protein Cmr2
MLDAVLIFTFSPIQSFIAEARRANDLYVGSRILVQLAQAAARAIKERQGTLIYPATLTDDVPNVIVARVPWDGVEAVAQAASQALSDQWNRIAETARYELSSLGSERDDTWEKIWERQLSNLWEVYWAASEQQEYGAAYREAREALDAIKRTRTFRAIEESGLKDSLSGCRTALHTDGQNAKAYWAVVSQNPAVRTAKLRPDGRERLDSIGAVKRFSSLAEKKFPSTSTVASRLFLELAHGRLAAYRRAVEDLLENYIYAPHRNDSDWPYPEWPYDGDLLFMETLTDQRLKNSYGLPKPDEKRLRQARTASDEVYRQVKTHPTPYYAIIKLDGDSMGEWISKHLEEADPEKAHSDFSLRLAAFASQARPIVTEYHGDLIYNGGDDVLALAPLSKAFPLAAKLAAQFNRVTGCTASAGLAIVHHLYPLDAALSAARQAESRAKKVADEAKAALCVRAIKRSGEMLEVRSSWEPFLQSGMRLEYSPAVQEKRQTWGNATGVFVFLVNAFQDGALSSRFVYEVASEARIVAPLADSQAHAAILKRLVMRHRTDELTDPVGLRNDLLAWAEGLNACVSKEEPDGGGIAELGRWLILARFVAQEGSE